MGRRNMSDSVGARRLVWDRNAVVPHRRAGAVRKGISVMKNRASGHEDTIREMRMLSGRGIAVGEPLRAFQNVLTGIPTFSGAAEQMLEPADARDGF